MRIAIADDNKDHAYSLATLIREWGHDAHVFLDAHATLTFCERHSPDVLLLDVGFPLRTDGLAAAKKARMLLQPDPVTIIAITGFDDEATRTQAKDAGFDHFLVKPIDLDKLRSLLTEAQSTPQTA
ncbi:MAG: response regulator [Gemmatales bacterium]